jgi:hypothetical protein
MEVQPEVANASTRWREEGVEEGPDLNAKDLREVDRERGTEKNRGECLFAGFVCGGA